MESDGATTTEGKGAQTRRNILDAAIARFGRDGFRSTSVADIARDAGVGGTAAYAYFPNKEALFLAAVDEDAAAVIEEGLSSAMADDSPRVWRRQLVNVLIGALDHHPLARRLLAGLEPEVTVRVLEIPALEELRKALAEKLRSEQLDGTVRTDIDPAAMSNAVVAVMLSLLMSVVQLGERAGDLYGDDIATLFEAAIERSPAAGDRPVRDGGRQP
jgi:AcrR family transcriptional regulator